MDLTEGIANRGKRKLQLSKWPNCWVYLLIKEKGIKESNHHQLEGEMKRLCVCVYECELKGLSCHCGSRQGQHKRSRANWFLGTAHLMPSCIPHCPFETAPLP